jgi:hypothetical protein
MEMQPIIPMPASELRTIYRQLARPDSPPVDGLTELDGEAVYCIANAGQMPPFLMNVVGDGDVWMFLSSSGALTAGRIDENGALFPYETEDQLHHAGGVVGGRTMLRIHGAGTGPLLWEPWTAPLDPGRVHRRMYKTVVGHRVVFEEVDRGTGLIFRTAWSHCHEYGVVRQMTLHHAGRGELQVELLDGLLNILPPGIPLLTQQTSSCLVDAYKRSELDPPTGMGVFSLTALVSDHPAPAESLRCTVAWSVGLSRYTLTLDPRVFEQFRVGADVEPRLLVTGRRCGYMIHASVRLAPGQGQRWTTAADTGLDHVKLARLQAELAHHGAAMAERVAAAVHRSAQGLHRLVCAADGQQVSNDRLACAHHFTNTLFNCLRGGVFPEGEWLEREDLLANLAQRNRGVLAAHETRLRQLPDRLLHRDLLSHARASGDMHLLRLCHEYLPLALGRRHGDPSRPWNRFRIHTRDERGRRLYTYQGNWRDVFQNWEALCFSHPHFLESIICKFINASTADGFNPYRISQDGIEWEVPEPENPWSNIGYWGDHQIIYLLKLLESLHGHDPQRLPEMLHERRFSYADVPYRLRPYQAIVHDPRHTIDFDAERHRRIEQRVDRIGTDGRLLTDADGRIVHVTLAEKLLVPILAKLASFVPGGGIWMNTQRPEWNDANNALVGHGVSMVTLCYLRRHLAFLRRLLERAGQRPVELSAPVARWLDRTVEVLESAKEQAAVGECTPRLRRQVLDRLGEAFGEYREVVYTEGPGDSVMHPAGVIARLCDAALALVDDTIDAARRSDGLFESYMLLDLHRSVSEAQLAPLDEMLEGQVAAISSGRLSSAQVISLVEVMYASRLYRADQQSFMLYPKRELPAFAQRNRVPEHLVSENPLMRALQDSEDRSIIAPDADGVLRFHADFQNAAALDAALHRLAAQPRWAAMVEQHRAGVHAAYEQVFHHRAFTGRSGSMYAYEGIGCIYWHMVAKLLLAVQEQFWHARVAGEPAEVQRQLAQAYYRIRSGLPLNKSAGDYGAWPTDPYSHTPSEGGARQPGMTGQVKEEILTRFGELGVRLTHGRLHFDPALLHPCEFTPASGTWTPLNGEAEHGPVELPDRSVAYTYCGTPVVYRLIDEPEPYVSLTEADGTVRRASGLILSCADSDAIFERRGLISRIDVSLQSQHLLLKPRGR